MNDDTLAIRAHKNSIRLAQSGQRQAWLDLFADNALVNDPVGPSELDPEGKGFRGRDGIGEFWDKMIGPGSLTIVSHRRIPCGEYICACDITAANTINGVKTAIEMVVIYEVDKTGKLLSLKAYWDTDTVAAQIAAQS